jgi:signal transduction histidine kinase
MSRGADRIREIVLALQNFSRLDEADMKPVNIHEGIDSTMIMLQHRLRETERRPSIHVTKEYSDLPLVTCYPSDLNQVFMNIISNAIDALDRGTSNWELGTGNIVIPIDNPQSPIPTIHIQTQLTSKNTVRIGIADNGPGMDESVRSRLFDPFFTTKPVGKGRGLGLSISYQIVVNKHQGTIQCHSSVGKGAEFIVEIPIEMEEHSSS